MTYMVTAVALIFALATSQTSEEKKVIGWVEKVTVQPEKVVVIAKIDTGADCSSFGVEKYTTFERNGEQWVRFDLNSGDNQSAIVERKIHRMVRIKRHRGKPQLRPVVSMTLCMAGVMREAEVNLIDRTRFKYRMLVGRNFLKGEFLVDPDLMLTVEPSCGGDSGG